MTEPRPGDLFQPGDLVNNTYRVEAILGRGGTSDVYRARSEISGRLMALKVLKSEFSSNDDYLALLTREEAMREIRHDAVVRYAENNRTADGHVYLLIDYVDGPGLDKKLKEGPMPADDLLVICRRVAEGLEAAHARKIYHRDLSPDNIILRDGDPAQAVIIDFGIAKDSNPGAETIVGNEFAGKYAYAAPEQLAGNTDARTDFYSLGALLLANFRGKSPDVGKNPMEVVQRKAEPLDTEGVPEPLKSLIDKMAAPDPADRFQSASELLTALGGGTVAPVPQDDLSDATIIAPPPKKAADPAEPPSPPRKEAPRRNKALIPLIGGGAVVAGLAAAFATGVFTPAPQLPFADSYRLSLAKAKDALPRAVGFVPSEEIAEEIRQRIQNEGGTTDLTLANGDIAESWGTDVVALLDQVEGMDVWRISLDGNAVEVAGTTSDEATYAALTDDFADGRSGALAGTADILLNELIVLPDRIRPLLASGADCGPLTLVNAPPAGYGLVDTVQITGTLASDESRDRLASELRSVAGDRALDIDTQILNPALCLIDGVLPKAPPSEIDVAFYQGDLANAPNPSGEFIVGENPVIDVDLPAGVTEGYLSVSVLDVSGNVFHLLPNINRPDNAIADLRQGQEGPQAVRVAYSLDEAKGNGGLAFRVDDSTLGASKVIAIHSRAPLFSQMRPTSESASSFAEALLGQERNPASQIHSLDSRLLYTSAR